jgi:hypothetical protein
MARNKQKAGKKKSALTYFGKEILKVSMTRASTSHS